MRSRASCFKWEYPLLSPRSSSNFIRILPCLLVTSIRPFIFPSITSFRRQFLRKIWHLDYWEQISPSQTSVFLLNFQNHQMVTGITVNSSQRMSIKYTWILSPVNHDLIDLVVVFSSGMIALYWWTCHCGKTVLLIIRFLDLVKFTALKQLSLLLSCRLTFPHASSKMSSHPEFALIFSDRIFMLYLQNWLNISSNSAFKKYFKTFS
jgi:hypothetical protein